MQGILCMLRKQGWTLNVLSRMPIRGSRLGRTLDRSLRFGRRERYLIRMDFRVHLFLIHSFGSSLQRAAWALLTLPRHNPLFSVIGYCKQEQRKTLAYRPRLLQLSPATARHIKPKKRRTFCQSTCPKTLAKEAPFLSPLFMLYTSSCRLGLLERRLGATTS